MLFTQLAEMVIKKMSKAKEMNMLGFLNMYELSSKAAKLFKDTINVTLERALPQRKLVLLGRAMAKVILAHNVINLGDSGFNSGMIDNCLDRLRCDVSNLMNSYSEQLINKVNLFRWSPRKSDHLFYSSFKGSRHHESTLPFLIIGVDPCIYRAAY